MQRLFVLILQFCTVTSSAVSSEVLRCRIMM